MIFADLHIHSRYSRATSPRMDLKEIARFAKIKGLNLVGSGDFTHPKWVNQIKAFLTPDSGTDLYAIVEEPENPVRRGDGVGGRERSASIRLHTLRYLALST